MSEALDFDAYITLEEAAAISGLTAATLRGYAHRDHLRSISVGARIRFTTRRWLHEYLTARNENNAGQPAKPLPDDYIAPSGPEREPHFSEPASA